MENVLGVVCCLCAHLQGQELFDHHPGRGCRYAMQPKHGMVTLWVS
jgi:hypothetical protein